MFTIARKNLLKNTAASKTSYGVEFVVNDDGSITVNGTPNGENRTNERIEMVATIPAGKYIFSCCGEGGTLNVTNGGYFSMLFYADGSGTIGFDTGNGVAFELTEERQIYFYLAVIYKGYTANNLMFYPMLRDASDPDDTWVRYMTDEELIPKEFNVNIGGTIYPVEEFNASIGGVIYPSWEAATPFYWIQDGVVQNELPSAYNVTSLNPSNTYYRNSLTGFYMSGNDNANSTFKGVTNAVNTQGNKNMEIVVAILNGGAYKFKILDTEINAAGTYVVDVSEVDSVTIALELTAWQQSTANASISSIRFY